jgi:transcriptional regulator with XRE-family HTH domain
MLAPYASRGCLIVKGSGRTEIMANLVAWREDLERRLSRTPEYLAESLAFDLSLEIYRQMKELGLSQTAFASRLGVSKAYVSQIFDGKTNMTILSLAKIAKALSSDLTIIMKGRGTQHNRSVLDFPLRADADAANASSSPALYATPSTAESASYARQRNVT